MIIGIVFFALITIWANMAYYEYRVFKQSKGDNDITHAYGQLLASRKYIHHQKTIGDK